MSEFSLNNQRIWLAAIIEHATSWHVSEKNFRNFPKLDPDTSKYFIRYYGVARSLKTLPTYKTVSEAFLAASQKYDFKKSLVSREEFFNECNRFAAHLRDFFFSEEQQQRNFPFSVATKFLTHCHLSVGIKFDSRACESLSSLLERLNPSFAFPVSRDNYLQAYNLIFCNDIVEKMEVKCRETVGDWAKMNLLIDKFLWIGGNDADAQRILAVTEIPILKPKKLTSIGRLAREISQAFSSTGVR